jgi:hypothetical protein
MEALANEEEDKRLDDWAIDHSDDDYIYKIKIN